MKKLLITGGSGFVGGFIIEKAQSKYKVHAAYFTNIIQYKLIQTHKINLAIKEEIQSLLRQIKPDIIIHTAAISNPDFCEQRQELAMLTNIMATEVLAEWAKKNSARFIFTSTDMVFDGEKGNYREQDRVRPISYYAETKVVCEQLLTDMNFNCAICRLALVYGIGLTTHNTFFEKMIANLNERKPVTLFDDQFRSPILVDNLAEALLELAENNFTGIIHLSGGEKISRWDFGLKTCQLLNLPSDNLIKGSMFDFPVSAPRPQDISLINYLAVQVLKVKLFNCREGLQRIATTINP